MWTVLCPFLLTLSSVFRSRTALQVEILALSASDRCTPALRQQATEIDRGGRCVLGVAVLSLGRLAIRSGHRQTGDGYRLAPQRLPLVFDLEG